MQDAAYAEVYVEFIQSEAEGRTSPIVLNDYRPHFRVGDGEYLGVKFINGPSTPVSPGQSAFATVQFIYAPIVNYDPLQVGVQFEILEGNRLVWVGHILVLK
jgi:translation elongation factor EF-Tu-like GTPase